MSTHVWSTKCRWNQKLIAQFSYTLRDESFEPNYSMFGQKFTNTNKMLQCVILHYADFAPANLGQLNTASNTRAAKTVKQAHKHPIVRRSRPEPIWDSPACHRSNTVVFRQRLPRRYHQQGARRRKKKKEQRSNLDRPASTTPYFPFHSRPGLL
jgi:hypothetical protein